MLNDLRSADLSKGAAAPVLLWSTNTYLKFNIQRLFRRDKHFVWCSPVFEGSAQPRYAIGASQAASSDPATIYRNLHHAVQSKDRGCEKIISQKKVLRALAVQWAKSGTIRNEDRDEIFAMLRLSQISDFRPLVYVVPYDLVKNRVKLVPRPKRAGHQPEYILDDLEATEFTIIEPIPCH